MRRRRRFLDPVQGSAKGGALQCVGPAPAHRAMDRTPTLDDATVLEALRDVVDPELGENIVDLGLVEAIAIEPRHLRVTLLPTSATCPMSELLLDDAEQALQRLCAGRGIGVEAVMDWEGTWDPQRLSPELKARFGW